MLLADDAMLDVERPLDDPGDRTARVPPLGTGPVPGRVVDVRLGPGDRGGRAGNLRIAGQPLDQGEPPQ